jgi:hypothetical protein
MNYIDSDHLLFLVKQAEESGFLKAVNILDAEEKKNFEKMGIVTPVASWASWLKSKKKEALKDKGAE